MPAGLPERAKPFSLSSSTVIICEALIKETRPLLPQGVTYVTLPIGLHVNPKELNHALQQKILEVGPNSETILLGYGLCGQSVVGLKSPHSRIVIPRVDDCVSMLLGSENRRRQAERAAGTYYLTKSWIESGDHLFADYDEMAARLGAERAFRIFSNTLEHYECLALIAMGKDPPSQAERAYCQQLAARFNLRFEVIKGSIHVMSEMIRGRWDGGMIVAPPGKAISLADFLDMAG